MARKHSAGTVLGLTLLFLFGLPFALGGLLIDCGVFRQTVEDLQRTQWREVPCTILQCKLTEYPSGDSTEYRVTARYKYEFEGQKHVSAQVTNDDGDDSQGTFHKRLHAELEAARASGKSFRCFVNPRSPDEAILYRDVRWGFATFQTIAAIMFSGVGILLMAGVVLGWKRSAGQPSRDATGPAPWKQRADWASGEIRHSDRLTGRVLVWSGVAVLVLSIRSLIASGTAFVFRDDWLALLGFIPSAIGFFLITYGRRRRVRWRRYGDSVLQLASVPGVIGGSLAGVVRVERHVESPAGFIVRLRCMESTQTVGTGDDARSTRVRLVWEQERTILHEMQSAGSDGIAIPVLFAIPYSAPETEPGTRTQVNWTLDVRSASPEADYKAEFAVPVFQTSQSNPNFKLDESLLASYEAPQLPIDWQAPLRKAGVRSEPLENGGLLFVFPAGRNIFSKLFVILFQFAFVAGVAALCYFKWPVGLIPLTTFFGAATLYSIVDLFSYTSELEVIPTGLSTRGGLFGLGGRRDIPAAEIERILAAGAGTSGSPIGLDLFAVLTTGKLVRLAKRVLPSQAAENIVQQTEEILGRKPAKSSQH